MEANLSKKRVLYFVPEFPRLTETFIEREIAELIRRGNLDLVIFSLQKASGGTTDAVKARTVYGRLGVKNFILGLFYVFTRPSAALLALSIALKDSSRPFLGRIYLFLKALGYTRVFTSFKPNHLHAHFMSDPSTVIMISSIILDIPFSISGHARDVFVDGTLLPQKLKYSKFIAVCNSFACNKAKELGGEENQDKVHKIYHGVDAQRIEKAVQMPRNSQQTFMLTVARLVEKKGLRYLIEASSLLKENGVDHEIHIVGGPGDLYEELKELIEKKGLEETVFIEGEGKGVSHEKVLSFYKTADIFVLPSIETGAGDVDGVPNVIVEAALAKLPIVTTDAGGITDLIEHGVTGMLVNQKDPQAISTQLYKLSKNPELRKTLGENAYSKAIQMFNLSENVGKLERLFLV